MILDIKKTGVLKEEIWNMVGKYFGFNDLTQWLPWIARLKPFFLNKFGTDNESPWTAFEKEDDNLGANNFLLRISSQRCEEHSLTLVTKVRGNLQRKLIKFEPTTEKWFFEQHKDEPLDSPGFPGCPVSISDLIRLKYWNNLVGNKECFRVQESYHQSSSADYFLEEYAQWQKIHL